MLHHEVAHRDGIVARPWIIVAAEPITDVDIDGCRHARGPRRGAQRERGTSLVFAEMKDPVRAKIERYELTRTIDPAHFFPTLTAAIAAFQRETGADRTPSAADTSPGG